MTCSLRQTGAAAVMCLLTGTWLLAQAPTLPQFRAGAVLVTVDAYPQLNGRIVEGLTAGDFEVLEDGKPQKIENLEFVRIEPAAPEAIRRDPSTIGEMRAIAADPHARVFVAFLDQLHTTVEGSHAIRQPLIDTLRSLVGPDDLFGVMTQNMRPEQLTLGRAMLSIEEQLTKYWPWGERQRIGHDRTDPVEDNVATCFHQYSPDGMTWLPWLIDEGPVKRYLDDILIERRREDRTLTSLEDLVRFLPKIREGRTVVLGISDGWMIFSSAEALVKEPDKDFRTKKEGRTFPPPLGRASDTTQFRGCLFELERLARLDNQRRFRDLMTAANTGNVSFYPVATTGLAAFDSSLGERVISNPDNRTTDNVVSRDAARVSRRVESLQTLAENTDGIAIVRTNDLASGLRRVVDDMSAYYLLGYYSTNTKNDGRFRRIQVHVKRPGLNVRARRGYLAPSEAQQQMRGAAAAAVSVATTSSAVDDALAVLARLQPTSEVFTYGAASSRELVLITEISSALTGSGKWTRGGDVKAAITGPNGETVGTASARIEPATRAALLRVPLSPGAIGPWRVTIQIAGTGESLEDRVSIDRTTIGPLLGVPLLYRAAPGPRSPIWPVADLEFRRTERVHIEWSLLKTPDQRQARLLNRTGQPLAVAVSLSEPPGAAQPMLAADVNLAPLSAGDYVIEVTAGAGPETERRLIAIRVKQ